MKYIIIFIFVVIPTLSYGAFYSETVVNGGDCLYIQTASSGTYGEYITSPSPYGDTDFVRNGFSLTGSSSDCSDTGITSGVNGGIFAQTPADGDYTFVGGTSGASTFYICDGVWELTDCSAPPPDPDPEPPATTTATTTPYANIEFGIAIIITLLSMALTGFIWNSIQTRKKPWQK